MAGRQFNQKALYTLALSALVFFGCGPKPNSIQTPAPAPQGTPAFNEEAQPTQVIPQSTNPGEAYEAPPTTIINKKKVEIRLGQIRLSNARIDYSPTEKRVLATGHATLLNSKNEKLGEKDFALKGNHTANQVSFKLIDVAADFSPKDAKKLLIRGQASCLLTSADGNIDCSHVVVDVYISNEGQIYSDQIEVNLGAAGRPPVVTAPEEPTNPADQVDDQKEDQDQSESTLQSEGNDGSVGGRYDGPAENVDLDDLFADPGPGTPEGGATAPPAEPPSETPPSETPPSKPVLPHPAPVKPPVKPPEKPAPSPKPEPPPERPLTPDLSQTPDGNVRPVNQAIGLPDAGRLRNATSLLTKQQALADRAFFEVVAPARKTYFCTYEMSEMIQRSGSMLNQRYNKKMYVSSVSAQTGGHLNPHASHQMGTDADLGYPTDSPGVKFPLVVQKSTRAYYPKNYSVEKTYNTFKFLFSQSDIKVDRIFVDEKIKAALCEYAKTHGELVGAKREPTMKMFEALQHVTGHGDHFHLRLRCSASDPSCRSRVYRKMTSCNP